MQRPYGPAPFVGQLTSIYFVSMLAQCNFESDVEFCNLGYVASYPHIRVSKYFLHITSTYCRLWLNFATSGTLPDEPPGPCCLPPAFSSTGSYSCHRSTKNFHPPPFFFSGCLKSPKCQLEHSLSAHEVKNSVELESMERRGQEAKKEDEEGVLTKLHNIR